MAKSKTPKSTESKEKQDAEDRVETPEENPVEAGAEVPATGSDTVRSDVATEDAAVDEPDGPAEVENEVGADSEPAAVEGTAGPEDGDTDMVFTHRTGSDETDDSGAADTMDGGDSSTTTKSPFIDSEPERPTVPPPPATGQGNGFMPMALGGIVAGAIGFGAAYFMGSDSFETEGRAALSDQASQIETLDQRIQAVVSDNEVKLTTFSADLASTSAAIDEIRANLTALTERIGGLEESQSADIAALDQRLTDLAKRPIADTVSREAIEAYEGELERLQGIMEEQRKAIEETIAAETAKMEVIAAEATQFEERALAESRLAAARSSVTRVLNALETAEPFEAALAELADNTDAPIDPALQAVAAEGVVTQAKLRERFPDAARAALRAARESGETGETAEDGASRIGGVLEKMFQVRSVEPRDGVTADAILSRAEAAVRAGDLETALSEVKSLPEAAKEPLAEWTADAEARLTALSAAKEIAARLNQG